MKVKHTRVLVLSALVLSSALYAQEAKAPKLKDSVALELRTLQLQISNSNVQMLSLEKQYKAVQESVSTLNESYMKKLHTALKESDLDETKYQLDPNTLEVKPSAKSQDKK